MTYRIKSGFILRTIGNQNMAIPVGKRTTDIHGMIALSESGVLLWKALAEGADTDTLVLALTDEYEIDEVTARNDVMKFLDGLREQGALE